MEIKGRLYSLRDAIRDNDYDKPSLVIGIFMTFFDVHVNRIPYRGRLSYKQLDPIDSYNYPMLDVEKAILDELRIDVEGAHYLHNNERMLNTIVSPEIQLAYQLLQIADYDVDCIAHFEQKQNRPVEQTAPFSQVRFGSQVDLDVVVAANRVDRAVAAGDRPETGLALPQPELVAPVEAFLVGAVLALELHLRAQVIGSARLLVAHLPGRQEFLRQPFVV